jgi:feruloyl-CoA synthase
MRALADEHAPRPVPLTASWGATETAPAATSAHFDAARCGCIGVPIPGTTLKLAPEADKLEIRVKGPNVMPGYHDNREATDAAFDDEGFYRTGDAARLVDEDDPGQGLMFDGRLAEDFKLATGTWVTVGRLRPELVSALAVARDAVITGHDRDEVGALVWIDDAAAHDPRLRDLISERLAAHNAGAGSASQVRRVLLLDEPPAIDAGEITDKGYVNQRAVLRRRAELVARLYAQPADPAVILAPVAP